MYIYISPSSPFLEASQVQHTSATLGASKLETRHPCLLPVRTTWGIQDGHCVSGIHDPCTSWKSDITMVLMTILYRL